MSTTLVYHKPGETGQVSSFDVAILRLVERRKVDIACPYLSVEYLKRVIALTAKWRLLTDVDAWISSQDQGERKEIVRFLTEFPNNVHHYPQLHAKAVVSEEGALVGSANLTFAGVQRNIEMAVTITDAELVNELRHWFQSCWDISVLPLLDNLSGKLDTYPNPQPRANLVATPADSFHPVDAKLDHLEAEGAEAVQDDRTFEETATGVQEDATVHVAGTGDVPGSNLATDTVDVGTRVCLKDLDTGDEEVYELVWPGQEDYDYGRVLARSPRGQALLGRKIGETVVVNVPRGTLRYNIISVFKIDIGPQPIGSEKSSGAFPIVQDSWLGARPVEHKSRHAKAGRGPSYG